MLSNPRARTTAHFPVLWGDESMEMRRITLVPYQCTTMAWNPRINTHPNDNGRLAATIKRILSQIGPATTPPTATAAGQTWQRSGQIAWLFFAARWRLWITHTHSWGVKTGWGKEWQAAEKDFPSHRCLPAAGKLGTEENSAIPGTS